MEQTIQQTSETEKVATFIPDLFDLRAKGNVFITYSASSFAGKPLFSYKDRHREVNASGAEIQRVATDIGTLITVKLESDEQGDALMFSVLIPKIFLTTREERIATVGIYTHDRALPPMKDGSGLGGQLQDYQLAALEGTARFVVF